MGKKLTIQDATKDELIEYFFNPISGGFLINADKQKFLLWLGHKRSKKLFEAIDASIDDSKKAFEEYFEWVKRANDEEDIETKIEYFEKANKAYERYENANKKYDSLNKKYDKEFKDGWV